MLLGDHRGHRNFFFHQKTWKSKRTTNCHESFIEKTVPIRWRADSSPLSDQAMQLDERDFHFLWGTIMSQTFKLNLAPATTLSMLMLSAPIAFAQTETVSEETQIAEASELVQDTIVITGFRNTLLQARDAKRNSNIVQDSIVAEDIAKFPDLNLAESLQRLPGVSINREAGEGRRVSLRGLGSDFTRVQLNGMEVLGNVDSPQDSRGQQSRDRAFDFNIFASDLFTRVDVAKSFSAEQNEGGLAGTIGLFTAKPFDYSGFKAAGSFKGGTNTATEDFQPRFSGLISNNWGDFGALFSIAYSTRETEEQGYNTYRWRPRNDRGSDISNLPQADQDIINSGLGRFPRGNRLSVWSSEQERLGITSAFQWAPAVNAELTLDVLYGEFDGDRDELHLASRGSSSTWLGGGTTVNGVAYPNSVINEIRFASPDYDGSRPVTYLDVSGANIATETRRQETKNQFEQIVLSGEWDIADNLRASGLIGTESSDFDVPISDKFYLEQHNDVISVYNGFDAFNIYGFDTTDASLWRAHEIDFEEVYQSSSFDNAKFDIEYDLNDVFTLKTGLSYQKFENSQQRARANNVLRSDWQSGAVDDDVTAVAQTFSEHDDQAWTIVNFDAALSQFGVTRDPSTFSSSIIDVSVEEETTAAYVQADWETEFSGMPFRGNVGVRYYSTDLLSENFDNEASSEASYDGYLPSVNASLEVVEDTIIRAAYSQNINRLGLGSLAPSTFSIGGAAIEELEVSQSSDPSLDPFESDNFDLSIERYFGEVGMVAVGVFHKKIENFVGNQSFANVPFGQTGASLDDLISEFGTDVSNDTNVSVFRTPINFGETDLTGLEFTVQSDFFFLPAPFNNLGFTGNATLLDADFEYADPIELAEGTSYNFSFPGLSEQTVNATLYYETDIWGGRVSANYRSDYVQSGRPTANFTIDGVLLHDEVGRGQEETLYVDFAAFYELNDQIKFTFDAVNLTDEEERQYSDIEARRLYNVTTAGTTFFAGVSFQY